MVRWLPTPERAAKFIKKLRKCPTLSTKKVQSQESFDQLQQQHRAMNSLVKFATETQAVEEEDDPGSPKLLSALIHSFAAHNCDPTPKAYDFILKTLSSSSRFLHIPAVLCHLEAVERFETPEFILVDLMKSLCKGGRFQEAINLFCSIPKFRCVPSVLSLNALLSSLCGTREGLEFVPDVLLKCGQMGIRIGDSSLRILIKALSTVGSVHRAINLLKYLISIEMTLDAGLSSVILSALCGKEDYSIDILGFLEEMEKLGFCPGLGDYTNVIKYLVKISKGNDALDVLNRMKTDGFKPTIACYTWVLRGLIEAKEYARAENVFDELLVFGLVPNIYIYNLHISGLCKQNRIEEAISMIGFMEELCCTPNETSYEIVFLALHQAGQLGRASELWKDMQSRGVNLNLNTHLTIPEGFVGEGSMKEAF
ncbi:hypothetical protein SAY86_012728 [Trapa natans]|uniref:Pentatricopeptide repeat-containing protein n=1 Tax=Trapa natans TaxID=22666 RepID=A0AAN7R7I1_TRANT|nr:hypothetical protein SAY86_012728 [Trapa natans]